MRSAHPSASPAWTRCCTAASSDRLYLVDGNPGAGKTTLALQFLLEGVARRRAVPVRHAVGDARKSCTPARASHGWSLDGIEIVELIADEHELDGEARAHDVPPVGGRAHRDDAQGARGGRAGRSPQRMVLDSLSELRLLAQSSLRYRRQILALKQFFAGRDCTVLLLDDRTAEGADLQLQSIAHGVISLDHRAPAYGGAQRQLQVVKFRGSDFRSGFHDFAIRRGGLEVFPRLIAAEHGRRVRARAGRRAASPRSTRCSAAASTAARARCSSGRPGRASRRSRCSTPSRPPRAATTPRSSPSTSRTAHAAGPRRRGLGIDCRAKARAPARS